MTQQIETQLSETQVQDLTADQLEQVAGGTPYGGVLLAFGDGSVRATSDFVPFRARFGTGVP